MCEIKEVPDSTAKNIVSLSWMGCLATQKKIGNFKDIRRLRIWARKITPALRPIELATAFSPPQDKVSH